ncbi:hypothetical protein [Streptomyces sp. Je 1-369]|uniref:hypothetical protein n=1 Tax=Streptomyces sp. Je 1-369 TaxID=2966192 RepID=UPI002285943D|nr:hypothetical protein [Streptomyces sp. Je 1-369]WAL98719.1 hypothetical protein NOO62_32115 [Streptomyces sp. Je 1-369]
MKPPTAAQRRIIEAADPQTGRLSGTEAQLRALVRARLAFRHPRPPHACFLTPAGHRVRDEGVAPAPPSPEPPPPAPTPASSGVFAARTGTETEAQRTGSEGPARAREVRSAWEGLVELRRMTNPDGARDRPCAWERTHLVQAAALALEAAGCRPASPDRPGYRVSPTPQPEAVAVREPTPEGIRACAAALERSGWQAGEHAEPRGGGRYVLASPRRV